MVVNVELTSFFFLNMVLFLILTIVLERIIIENIENCYKNFKKVLLKYPVKPYI